MARFSFALALLALLAGACVRATGQSVRLARCADCPTTLDSCFSDPGDPSTAQCTAIVEACQACGKRTRAPAPAGYLATDDR